MGRASGAGHAAAGGGAPRGGRPREWTEERLFAELSAIVADLDVFPTQQELCAAGHGALAYAVSRNGGTDHWAARVGKPLRREQRVVSYSEPYTDAMAVADARALIATHGRLPGSTKLRQLDHPRLAAAVIRAGGAAEFCRRHGLG